MAQIVLFVLVHIADTIGCHIALRIIFFMSIKIGAYSESMSEEHYSINIPMNLSICGIQNPRPERFMIKRHVLSRVFQGIFEKIYASARFQWMTKIPEYHVRRKYSQPFHGARAAAHHAIGLEIIHLQKKYEKAAFGMQLDYIKSRFHKKRWKQS